MQKFKRSQIRVILILAALGVAWLVSQFGPAPTGDIYRAIENRQSDVQVKAVGEIVKVLPDDNRGSRHQRLLVELQDGHTILIAHNIDLAPRIENPSRGEKVKFYGEFEWNDKGGVVHWTHHDPQGRHVDGWLEYQDRKYQ